LHQGPVDARPAATRSGYLRDQLRAAISRPALSATSAATAGYGEHTITTVQQSIAATFGAIQHDSLPASELHGLAVAGEKSAVVTHLAYPYRRHEAGDASEARQHAASGIRLRQSAIHLESGATAAATTTAAATADAADAAADPAATAAAAAAATTAAKYATAAATILPVLDAAVPSFRTRCHAAASHAGARELSDAIAGQSGPLVLELAPFEQRLVRVPSSITTTTTTHERLRRRKRRSPKQQEYRGGDLHMRLVQRCSLPRTNKS